MSLQIKAHRASRQSEIWGLELIWSLSAAGGLEFALLGGWRTHRALCDVCESSEETEFHCGLTTTYLQVQEKLIDRDEPILTSMAHAKYLPKWKNYTSDGVIV